MSSLEQEAVISMKKLDREPSEVCIAPVRQTVESPYLRLFSDLEHVRPATKGRGNRPRACVVTGS
jgi:hypothetical protein